MNVTINYWYDINTCIDSLHWLTQYLGFQVGYEYRTFTSSLEYMEPSYAISLIVSSSGAVHPSKPDGSSKEDWWKNGLGTCDFTHRG